MEIGFFFFFCLKKKKKKNKRSFLNKESRLFLFIVLK